MLSLPRFEQLDPIEFCRIYARKKEGEWGYKASWRSLLAYICGVSDGAVQQWGRDFEKCPEHHRRYLAAVHGLKEAEKSLAEAQRTLKSLGLDGPLQ
jgi:hypothetical protein